MEDRPVSILYVSSELYSVHEHRFLKMLSSDPSIRLKVASLNLKGEAHYPGIDELEADIEELHGKRLSGAFPALRLLHDLWGQIRALIFLKRILSKGSYDIIHASELLSNAYLSLKTGFRPVLAMSWGSDVLDNPFSHYNPHRSAYLRMRLRHVAREAGGVYSDAQYVVDTLERLCGFAPKRTFVFPQLGVDTELFRPDPAARERKRNEFGIAPSTKVIFMSRNMKAVYGVGDFLSAMPEVLKAHPDVLALIAGDGELLDEMKSMSARLGIADKVRFLGRVQNSMLSAYYNAADLYVSTSHSDGTSLSLLEAMSCALPVCVSDVPSIMEWVAEGVNGTVCKRGDTSSISQALTRILSAPERMAAFSEANRAKALEKAGIDANYKRLVSAYKDIIRGGGKGQ